KNFAGISVKARNADQIPQTISQIKLALLRDLEEDDFSVISTEDVLQSIQSVLQMLTAGIGAIAGISLLVGGIGIMNIMLVSVTERIKEIGLRKALGATPINIALQFLFESIMISVAGGSIGLFLGWGASRIAANFVRTEVPVWTAVLAIGFSVVVGVLFGTYPAIKASKKDPIEALRYE
nr:FtsX-like permease family protein [Patescibacteria group bacterium]